MSIVGPGGAVQVDPIKPTLKAPGTKRLKPYYDEPPSDFDFKFKLRRYTPDHRCPQCILPRGLKQHRSR